MLSEKYKGSTDIICSVYQKPTNSGIYLNYNSEFPQCYKNAAMYALIHRTYKISSNWQLFNNHIHTLKQAFVYNSYPNHLFDTTLNRYLSKLNASPIINYTLPPPEPLDPLPIPTPIPLLLSPALPPNPRAPLATK